MVQGTLVAIHYWIFITKQVCAYRRSPVMNLVPFRKLSKLFIQDDISYFWISEQKLSIAADWVYFGRCMNNKSTGNADGLYLWEWFLLSPLLIYLIPLKDTLKATVYIIISIIILNRNTKKIDLWVTFCYLSL